MILVFIAKDIDVLDDGYKDMSDELGIAYAYVPKLWPGGIRLEKKENLFITAHGNKKVIGDEGPTLSIDATTLAKIIAQIIPVSYTGDIYMSTCNSFEFAKKLKKEFGSSLSATDFYGTKKSIPYKIQGPAGDSWHQAP
ncbi:MULTISPECIES: hypothetical protein [unclassified Nocardia]|uniref:hypothetical protein n=1 Tax=unclassified Nocardia TaxID=2637762 RepID=UPI0035E25D0B